MYVPSSHVVASIHHWRVQLSELLPVPHEDGCRPPEFGLMGWSMWLPSMVGSAGLARGISWEGGVGNILDSWSWGRFPVGSTWEDPPLDPLWPGQTITGLVTNSVLSCWLSTIKDHSSLHFYFFIFLEASVAFEGMGRPRGLRRFRKNTFGKYSTKGIPRWGPWVLQVYFEKNSLQNLFGCMWAGLWVIMGKK